MRSKKMKILIVVFLIVGAGLLLCSMIEFSGKEKKDSKRYGGVYVYAMTNPIASLNPKEIVWINEKMAVSLIFDQLISIDRNQALKPVICKSWALRLQGRVFVCKLRKDVFFHNGQRLNADDVVFSLNYLLQKEGLDVGGFKFIEGINRYWNGLSKSISGIKKSGEHEIIISLKKSFPGLAANLALKRFVIMPKGFAGMNEKEFFNNPIGSGPFKFKSKSDNVFEVVSNNRYFLGRPYLDSVIFKVLPYEESVRAFKRKEVHEISDYGVSGDFENIEHAEQYIYDSYSTVILYLNNSRKPFNDIRFRKLLYFIVNKERIFKECYNSVHVAYNIIPRGILGHDSEYNNVTYDLTKAKRIVESLSRDVSPLTIYYDQDILNNCSVEIIHNAFEKIGLPWKLRAVSANFLGEGFFANKIDAFIEMDKVKGENPYTILKYFESNSNENLARINDKEIDNLLKTVLSMDGLYAKSTIYKKIDRKITNNYYALPLFYPTLVVCKDKRFKEEEKRLFYRDIDFRKIWKVEKNL